jgi:large subunit ribosomal protein L19
LHLGEFRQQCRRQIGGGSRRAAPLQPAAAEEEDEKSHRVMVPQNYRFVYPEFLPDPNLEFRNFVREKLERSDMMRRRTQIDVPEFYVGSVLGVTCSDQHALGKTTRFVGICIQRRNCGLRADFTLRNVVDNQGATTAHF